MKFFKYLIVSAIAVLALSTSANAQRSKPVSTEFTVGGVCEMCEKRIEKAMDVPGVVYADYDLSNHKLSLVYKPHKITEERIHEILNEAGHDTEKSKATQEQYDAVHHCCKYRDHEHNHDDDH